MEAPAPSDLVDVRATETGSPLLLLLHLLLFLLLLLQEGAIREEIGARLYAAGSLLPPSALVEATQWPSRASHCHCPCPFHCKDHIASTCTRCLSITLFMLRHPWCLLLTLTMPTRRSITIILSRSRSHALNTNNSNSSSNSNTSNSNSTFNTLRLCTTQPLLLPMSELLTLFLPGPSTLLPLLRHR